LAATPTHWSFVREILKENVVIFLVFSTCNNTSLLNKAVAKYKRDKPCENVLYVL
jgi:hypothetical protein